MTFLTDRASFETITSKASDEPMTGTPERLEEAMQNNCKLSCKAR